MRRAAAVLTAILLLICIALPVYAQSGATAAEAYATVNTDGSCQVSLRMTIHLDSPVDSLTFPLPQNAYDVTVNGVAASTARGSGVLLVDLSRIIGSAAGDLAVNLSYSLTNVVAEDSSGYLVLSLPMLCGFTYPVEGLSFSITLPGDVEGKPTFTSTYHQTTIEQSLNYTVTGSQIVGNLTKGLMGSDWLTMTLRVSEEMFPQEKPIVWTLDMTDLLMILCAVVAFVYWLVSLRCLPPRQIHRTTAPDGITAADVATVITGGKPNLTMLVVHWAQLGYILIQLDDNGRVFLHKRMSMGNERSLYENRIFRSLFGRRTMVDGTGYHYAQLCRKVAAGKPAIHGLYKRGSGNPTLFRLLAALSALCGGVVLGQALGADSIFRSLLTVILSVFGVVSAWFIQAGGKCLHLRSKQPLWLALGLCAVWLVLGAVAGELPVAACVAAGELFAGVAAAYGGQRTDLGKQAMEQVLGLRRHMKHASKEELQRILKANPDYFYDLAPYALALGVDRQFAQRFGSTRMGACLYLTSGMDGHMTAGEWDKLLRDAVNTLEERQRQLFWERLFGR